MQAGVVIWISAFVVVLIATCWRLPGQQARKRRCTQPVQGTYLDARKGAWVQGDAGEEASVSQPVYAYEYRGERYQSAAGAPTMLYDYSPAGKRRGEAVELCVNPDNPSEVYDVAYERWFATYRFIWCLIAFAGLFVLVSLLQAIT